jgi:hypothetical protein
MNNDSALALISHYDWSDQDGGPALRREGGDLVAPASRRRLCAEMGVQQLPASRRRYEIRTPELHLDEIQIPIAFTVRNSG